MPYRYVTDPDATTDSPLCRFPAFSANMLKDRHAAIRIAVLPDAPCVRTEDPPHGYSYPDPRQLWNFFARTMVNVEDRWTEIRAPWTHGPIRDWRARMEADDYVLTRRHGFIRYDAHRDHLVRCPDGIWELT